MVTPQDDPETKITEAARRLRRRNWAMLVVLLGLFVLLYAMTMAKGRR